MPHITTIRSASAHDFPRIQELEIAAGQLFRTIGYASIANDDPPSLPELEHFADNERLLVSCCCCYSTLSDEQEEHQQHDASVLQPTSTTETITGYITFEQIDHHAFIHQVSVHLSHSRLGIGTALIAQVAAWATRNQLVGLSLTTFEDVPWNMPYYRRLGFKPLSREEEKLDENRGLQLRLLEERRNPVLSRWRRVAMRKALHDMV